MDAYVHAGSVGGGKLGAVAAERVTSVDVARRAGVSQSTVSLVFSGKAPGRISGRTEAAVRAAAEELGYRPNAAARALKTGAARTVALGRPRRHEPVLRRAAPRRPDRRARGELRGRADRHEQRPRLGRRVGRGAAGRPGRRAACCSRSTRRRAPPARSRSW